MTAPDRDPDARLEAAMRSFSADAVPTAEGWQEVEEGAISASASTSTRSRSVHPRSARLAVAAAVAVVLGAGALVVASGWDASSDGSSTEAVGHEAEDPSTTPVTDETTPTETTTPIETTTPGDTTPPPSTAEGADPIPTTTMPADSPPAATFSSLPEGARLVDDKVMPFETGEVAHVVTYQLPGPDGAIPSFTASVKAGDPVSEAFAAERERGVFALTGSPYTETEVRGGKVALVATDSSTGVPMALVRWLEDEDLAITVTGIRVSEEQLLDLVAGLELAR
ncbi:MAG TPA: hypothetical protein VK507_21365 [Iamia sp.]|nr:hypothetical protein [Iamia sp.]